MKVAIFGLASGRGGIQTHIYWLTKTLLEAGAEVLIISPRVIREADINELIREGERNPRLTIVNLQSEKKQRQKNVLANLSLFFSLAQQLKSFAPDIYFGVGPGWNMSMMGLFLPRQTVKIFHEVMSGVKKSSFDPRLGVRYTFTDVFAQATDVAMNFRDTFQWQKPIPVLPAFPEPLENTALLPSVVSKSVPLGKAKVALFSRLAPHKQGLWLVKQWDFLQNYMAELHIHGGGEEESLIREYIKEKGLCDRIKCWGRYPDSQDYVNLLSSYDFTVLPTIGAEGSPLVLLESMACGVPFVAYGVGGIPDYGKNNPDVMVIAPEKWITDQAREYNTTSPQGEVKAFLEGVKLMAEKLDRGEINQLRLQQFYFSSYSYTVLQKLWLDHFQQIIKK